MVEEHEAKARRARAGHRSVVERPKRRFARVCEPAVYPQHHPHLPPLWATCTLSASCTISVSPRVVLEGNRASNEPQSQS